MKTLDGYPIEDYANKLFRTWGIGKKNEDNGLLIFLAINDRNWRVEVGRGLEGVVPDTFFQIELWRKLPPPRFIEGDYNLGILGGI